MTFLQRFFPDHAGSGRREMARLLAMMGLFFLVVCAVGILRPIKNALALDGLGDTDFFKVYLVSGAVVFFVPLYNKLADRVAWRWLIPIVAMTFAVELVLFRVFYVEGSTPFGLIFYGWYDLFAAALVTQFFMATQLFFNARSAKQAYPLVIAGGSIGATLGGAVTGFFSETVGTPNLLLVAAALIAVFSMALPLVWGKQPPARTRRVEPQGLHAGEFRALLRNRQVRLIAIGVLLTVIVKQLVDYQFNTMTKEVFQDRDAISAFQGKFNAVTQWLPIVALAALQPALKRWGVGAAVLLLPAAMLITNIGLEIWWGLWAAVIAKGAETSLRYSTERAGREILYVPVPEEIKLKAKAYIDVAVEKGIGKVASAGLIGLLLLFMPYRQIALFGIGFCALWLFSAMAMRREYVRTLARSIEGRFASLRNSFASIGEASTRQAVRRALQSTDPLQIAFALDLASQAAPQDLRELAPDLNALLEHPAEGVRQGALRLLARVPDLLDEPRVRALLKDEAPAIREAAIEALCAQRDPETVLSEVLHSGESAARTAALSCVARGVVPAKAARWITRDYIDHHIAQARAGDREAKLEVALAAGVLQGERDAIQMVAELARDADTEVASAALHSAGRLSAPELYPVLLAGLAEAATRAAARASLIAQGDTVAPQLAASLLDPRTPHRVRRQIPVVLTHIPTLETGRALLRSYLAPETDQLLDFRALKAMSKLRARQPDIVFDRNEVCEAVRREAAAAVRYETVRLAVAALEADLPGVKLLCRSLDEAWAERRECAFRLLGLVHPPAQMRDCYQSLCTGTVAVRANAIEWLEHTIDRELFTCMMPLVREGTAGNGRSPTAAQALASLGNDNDAWVTRLADWSATELGLPGSRSATATETPMDLIEKVFLLQQVDLLQGARSAQLALLGSIALEQDIAPNTTLIRQNEPTAALYIVIRGAVELRTTGDQVMVARDNAAFGTWALIDQAPSMLAARTLEPTRVLCIEREDLDDLLSENPELALGLLQGLARRVRTLVA